jgi:hypothetical protein
MVRLASYIRQSARRESGSEASPATHREAVDHRATADPARAAPMPGQATPARRVPTSDRIGPTAVNT